MIDMVLHSAITEMKQADDNYCRLTNYERDYLNPGIALERRLQRFMIIMTEIRNNLMLELNAVSTHCFIHIFTIILARVISLKYFQFLYIFPTFSYGNLLDFLHAPF